ncbi:geranylgeranylglyceryl/heptaprenylglyceryl phosphate synthase [Membranihabitans marinus]
MHRRNNKKCFALLIDPDKLGSSDLDLLIGQIRLYPVDYIFMGGSLMVQNNMDICIEKIQSQLSIPIIIFPGDTYQLSRHADAVLLLSLISGRNPELLIGKQVIAAPYLKQSNLEILPTGYMLIDGGKPNSVSYMSNTFPIPRDKEDIAACTALAGEQLGLKIIYLDAGSGALDSIPVSMVKRVRQEIDLPIIVGGGIRSAEQAIDICRAGADIIVVGNAIESNPEFLKEMSTAMEILNDKISLPK